MTINEAKATCRALGFTLTHTDGEFRVNAKGSGEATAYYTDDLDDAVGTCRAMWTEEAAALLRDRYGVTPADVGLDSGYEGDETPSEYVGRIGTKYDLIDPCDTGDCGHYTCTEGGTLGYWSGADPRLQGNF